MSRTFLERVEISGLIEQPKLSELLRRVEQIDPEALKDDHRAAALLVELGSLSAWQADKLLDGKSAGFFVGSYRIVGPLGSGDTSGVYLVQHIGAPVLRSMRIVSRIHASSASWIDGARREFCAFGDLAHPRIVRVLELGLNQLRNYVYLVREYIEGQALADVIESKVPLGVRASRQYAIELAEALHFMHCAGFVHGAVAASNVIVQRDGTLKLLSTTQVKSVVGSTRAGLHLWVEESHPLEFTAEDIAVDIHGLGSLLGALLPLTKTESPVAELAAISNWMTASSSANRPRSMDEVIEKLSKAS